MSTARDRSIAAVAATQRGLVSRDQLAAAGLDRSTIRRRVAGGALVPAGIRTYRVAAAPTDPLTPVLAACLGRSAVASHLTAGWIHLLLPRPTWIDVTVAKGRSTKTVAADPVALRVHSSTSIPDDDVVVVDGIPTTSIARTMLGIAALVPTEVSLEGLVEIVSVADETGAASLRWMRWLLDHRRCRGRNGVTALEAALAVREATGPTESWLERHLLEVVAEAGLPRPALQRRIARDRGRVARVDFLYARERVVVEVLGYAFHRTPDQMAADTMRANELQARGYRVLQLTWRSLLRDRPAIVSMLTTMLIPAA